METALRKYNLPSKVHCPVCGESLLFLPLKSEDALTGQLSGALASTKISCGCGVEGVFVLRKTKGEGYRLYSMTFWILPKTAEQKGTLSSEELRRWLKKMPEPFRI